MLVLDFAKMGDTAGKDSGFMDKIKRVLPLAESTLANTFLVGILLFKSR